MYFGILTLTPSTTPPASLCPPPGGVPCSKAAASPPGICESLAFAVSVISTSHAAEVELVGNNVEDKFLAHSKKCRAVSQSLHPTTFHFYCSRHHTAVNVTVRVVLILKFWYKFHEFLFAGFSIRGFGCYIKEATASDLPGLSLRPICTPSGTWSAASVSGPAILQLVFMFTPSYGCERHGGYLCVPAASSRRCSRSLRSTPTTACHYNFSPGSKPLNRRNLGNLRLHSSLVS